MIKEIRLIATTSENKIHVKYSTSNFIIEEENSVSYFGTRDGSGFRLKKELLNQLNRQQILSTDDESKYMIYVFTENDCPVLRQDMLKEMAAFLFDVSQRLRIFSTYIYRKGKSP